ncbi:hypothetical protein BD769DRAFT_1012747 [Suillus cothurnatus]|nr:hypothetical protein BD769DRAFT_1012747 [Suillus cothurnatus]
MCNTFSIFIFAMCIIPFLARLTTYCTAPLLYRHKRSIRLQMFPIVYHNNRYLYTTFAVVISSIANSARMSWQHRTLESAVCNCPCANESVRRSSTAFCNVSPSLRTR